MNKKKQINLFDELSVVLFAGGGGADTGFSCATGRPVDLAINHSIDAIRMHKTNHPWTVHMQEDVFAVDPVTAACGRPVGILWASPDCTHFSKAKGGKPVKKEIRGLSWVVVKWALYTRPRVMFMENVEEIQTWGPCIETEKGLQPDPNRAGETYKAFIGILTTGVSAGSPGLLECCEFLKIDPMGTEAQQLIQGLGYDFDSKILCAADFGVPTIRKRWFAVFRCDGRPISFPEPTHAKNGEGGLLRWRSAAEIIDWSLPCPSIFASKGAIKAEYGLTAVRPLAENTLKRVIKGVDKYTIRSGKPFIVAMNHSGEFRGQDIDSPTKTITSKLGRGIVRAAFTAINTSNSVGADADKPLNTARTGGGGGQMIIAPELTAIGQASNDSRAYSCREPVRTVVSKAEQALLTPILTQYHDSPEFRGQKCTEPIMTIDASPRYSLAAAQLTEYFGNGQPIDIGQPAHTVTAKDREGLTLAHLTKYYGGVIGETVEKPLPTVTSVDHNALSLVHVAEFKGQDKGQSLSEPLRTVTASAGEFAAVQARIHRYSSNSDLRYWPEVRNLLNRYCGYSLEENEVLLIHIAETWYYISDIGLRMLTPRELYNAMGFPPDYIIDRDYLGRKYSKSSQVARCGNAVCPPVAGALIAANLKEYALPAYILTLAELWERMAI